MRTFISINPGEDALKSLSDIRDLVRQKIKEHDRKFLDSIKWDAPAKFHLTLFFIGEINDEKLSEIKSALTELAKDLDTGKLEFNVKGINAFPKLRYPRVLVLELLNNDKKIFELSGKIHLCLQKLGIVSDKPFKPHITLGRVRRDHKINLSGLESLLLPELNFSVNEFHLMKSELKKSGSEYSVIEVYGL